MTMAQTRKIEILSAGCAICETAVSEIRAAACPSCETRVLDMRDDKVAAWAESLGVRSLPAIVIDGTLADCCNNRGIDLDTLRAAGLGQSLG